MGKTSLHDAIARRARNVDGDGIFRTRLSEGASPAWLYPELPWGVAQDAMRKLPGRRLKRTWEILTSVSCVYVGFSVPLVLGFGKHYFPDGACALASRRLEAWELIHMGLDLVSDVIFICDILLTFVSAVWLVSCEGVPHWILVDDLASIRQLYLNDFFLWDVLGSIPYQYIECLAGQAGGAKYLRLLRLLKLLRLNRVRRLLMMLRQRFPEFEFAITCTELLLSLMLVAHWAAAVFFYIAYGLGDPAGDEYQVFLFSQGWVHNDGVLDVWGSENEHVSGPWLSAMYWSVTTLTTLGYGDISPKTAEERIVGMIVMCIGCIFFAWITGRFTSLWTRRPAMEVQFEAKLDQINEFLQIREIPEGLQRKIKEYYSIRFPTRQMSDHQAVIRDVLADLDPSLREQVALQLYQDVVARVPLFHFCKVEVQRSICLRLKHSFCIPGSVITREGEDPDALYIVRFGLVEVVAGNLHLADAGPGGIFGEMALLGLTPDGKRFRSATASTMCELCMLTTEDLHDLLSSSPNLLHVANVVVKSHLEELHLEVGERNQLPRTKLMQIDWNKAAEALKWEEMSNLKRNELNRVSGLRDSSFEDEGACASITCTRRALHTRLRIFVTKLSGFRPLEEVSGVIVVVYWPGTEETGSFFTQDETLVVSSRANSDGVCSINREIQIAIVSPHGNWAALPPLEIRVRRIVAAAGEDAGEDGTFKVHRRYSDPITQSLRLRKFKEQSLIDSFSRDGDADGQVSEESKTWFSRALRARASQGTATAATINPNAGLGLRDAGCSRVYSSTIELFSGKLALEKLVEGRCTGLDKQMVIEVPLALSPLLSADQRAQDHAKAGGRRSGLMGGTGGRGIYRLPSKESSDDFQLRMYMKKKGFVNTAFRRRFFVLDGSVLRYYLDEHTFLNGRAEQGSIELRESRLQTHQDLVTIIDVTASQHVRFELQVENIEDIGLLVRCHEWVQKRHHLEAGKRGAAAFSLSISAQVIRVLSKNSRWRNVMPLVRDYHPSQRFADKRRRVVEMINARQESLFDLIRAKRITSLPTTHRALRLATKTAGMCAQGEVQSHTDSRSNGIKTQPSKFAAAGGEGVEGGTSGVRIAGHGDGTQELGLPGGDHMLGLVSAVQELCIKLDRQTTKIEALEQKFVMLESGLRCQHVSPRSNEVHMDERQGSCDAEAEVNADIAGEKVKPGLCQNWLTLSGEEGAALGLHEPDPQGGQRNVVDLDKSDSGNNSSVRAYLDRRMGAAAQSPVGGNKEPGERAHGQRLSDGPRSPMDLPTSGSASSFSRKTVSIEETRIGRKSTKPYPVASSRSRSRGKGEGKGREKKGAENQVLLGAAGAARRMKTEGHRDSVERDNPDNPSDAPPRRSFEPAGGWLGASGARMETASPGVQFLSVDGKRVPRAGLGGAGGEERGEAAGAGAGAGGHLHPE